MFGLQIIYTTENNMYILTSLIRLMRKLIVEYQTDRQTDRQTDKYFIDRKKSIQTFLS